MAAEAWPPYLLLACVGLYLLAKAMRLRRRMRTTPPPAVMDAELVERLNAGRGPE